MSAPTFNKFRDLIWPIKRYELKKFIPMFLICFFICFIYSILRSAKDALVITASGAEVIPFIKVWAILPSALLITFLFTKLANRYPTTKVFYIMMSIFLSYYILFAFVLYPFQDVLHPHLLADQLEAALPSGFHGLIGVFRNWTFTLFYVMSELWGTAIMTVLFWGFANEVTAVEEAKRYYGILGVGFNLSTILAGVLSAKMVDDHMFKVPVLFSCDYWGSCLASIVSIVTFFGIASMILFYWLNKKVIKKCPKLSSISESSKNIKMSLKKNFSYLAKSKYLICIAVIVLMYNVCMNMIEIVWKDQMRELYPNPAHFNAYMGKVLIIIGIISTIVAWFACGNVIRRLGWTVGALVTPIALLLSGILFFSFVFLKETSLIAGIAFLLGTSPVALAVLFGSLQNCLTRACKYTLFDTTKEVAFIPLSNECKLKGKAAIDGVGSRLGKSGGSLVHGFLLMMFGSVALSTPYVALLLVFAIIAWIVATKSLGKKFSELAEKREEIIIEDNEQKTPTAEPIIS